MRAGDGRLEVVIARGLDLRGAIPSASYGFSVPDTRVNGATRDRVPVAGFVPRIQTKDWG
jgi:hypothetical protein